MNDPTRFTQTEPDSPEAMLLRSMRSDAPPSAAKKALLGALGLGAAGSLTGSAAAATSPGLLGAGIGKWLGVVGICGAALGVGYAAWNAGSSPSPAALSDGSNASNPPASAALLSPAQRIGIAPASAFPPLSQLPRPSPQSGLSGTPEFRPAMRPTATKPSPITERSARSSSSARGLSDEVAALERARRALSDEDGATALKALSEYDRQFAQRTLGPEAEVLRIEALLRSGNEAAGKAAARGFLARHPKSPLARRVRSLMAQTESSK